MYINPNMVTEGAEAAYRIRWEGKPSRLKQMRRSAKYRGKYVPSSEELESMIPADMRCPDCGKVMLWKSKKGGHQMHKVASLQHYRDGSLAIVCVSCNSRHASMPGDSYREMPKDHKYCPRCRQCKPRDTGFSIHRSHKGPLKTKSLCKSCSDIAVEEWRNKNWDKHSEYQRQYQKEWRKQNKAKIEEWRGRNRAKINEYQRRYRARRKAAGGPLVGRGSQN